MLNRKHRYKKFRFKKSFFTITAFLLLLLLGIKGFENQASRFSEDYIQSFAQQITTDAVCDAVEQKLIELNYSYTDLAKIIYSSNGTVQAIETDSTKINILKAEITRAAQNEIVKIKNSNAKIPLGAFTQLSLLSNSGPEVSLSFCLTGSFTSRLESEFENAGVNRTIHHIKLIVTSKIVTASVDYKGEMTFDTDFEIAQSVIVGEFPTIYGGIYATY